MSEAMDRASERAASVRSEVQRFLAELGLVTPPKRRRWGRLVVVAVFGVAAVVVAAVVRCAILLGED